MCLLGKEKSSSVSLVPKSGDVNTAASVRGLIINAALPAGQGRARFLRGLHIDFPVSQVNWQVHVHV